ncbi:MAG: sel1 repeat family protein, partial [Kiritimatiellae bacterium]|nr:sel1 repeat family protein [Kiritimatiellia bacterium]
YLALAFERGEGVPRNLQQALYWYQQAAEQGYADALNNLALMYENGIGIDKNKQKALQLYKQAADIGSDEGEQNYRRLLREKEEYNRRVRGY